MNLLSDLETFAEARRRFQAGTLTPRDYLERCIAAIEAKDPTIKAMVYTDFARARTLADEATQRYKDHRSLSPIDGLPVGVKDIIDVSGMPTQMNNDIYKGYYPKSNAACIEAILSGGGIPIGKTVTTEFAIGRSGQTVNPHNTRHTPGGSSSGSAAGVASGMFPIALGSQTQGSTIRPSSFCGIVGYKGTYERLSLVGAHQVAISHDHLGILADSVEDAWTLAQWLFANAATVRGMSLNADGGEAFPHAPGRVGVLRTQGFAEMDGQSRDAFDALIIRLQAQGVEVIEPDRDVHLQRVCEGLNGIPERSLDMVAYDMRQWHYRTYVREAGLQVGKRIHDLMERASRMSRLDYQAHLQWRANLLHHYTLLGDSYDALLLPSASGPAPEGFEYTGSRTFLVYSTFLGVPAFSLPLMVSGGLPFGLQLLGFPDKDSFLARQANWLCRTLGTPAPSARTV
jgi:Asp-tRNA(Asn)/Glu-tRNA(Gln) amidotransferase A subunit family amidase